MAKFTRILSIDGGGIRGIIPGQVLVGVEQKLQQHTGNRDARIADYFDLIAGTSTGGILTCLYLSPDLSGKAKSPRYTAQEAVNLYLERGEAIFDVSLWRRLQTLDAMQDEKYSEKALEAALAEYFGDLKLCDLLKPCLITAYDIENRKAKFFTQHDAVDRDTHDYLVKDVARATSAAPTYFQTARTRSQSDSTYSLVDGGVFANNPTLCAYSEVRTKFEKRPTAKDMVILSVGTGFVKKPYSYDHVKDWGKIGWIQPLIDILMSGVAETVDYQLSQIFDAVGKPEQYVRINDELQQAAPDMDNASRENLLALQQEGIRISEACDDKLDSLVALLTV